MINKIIIERQEDNWWKMTIEYNNGEFGCLRSNLQEILDELKHRV